MKILAPVTSLDEAKTLISEGAEELYCGLQPFNWGTVFGDGFWLNRRGPGRGNLTQIEELSELIAMAHLCNVKVFLTLNQFVFSDVLYQEIVRLVRGVYSICSPDALIIGDPGLMKIIKEKVPEAKLHASSMGAILNTEAAKFFRDSGATRIIFPRYMDLETMSRIIQEIGPEMEYEAFILNDGCIFEEAYCFVNHAFGGAICHNPHWSYKVYDQNGRVGKEENLSFSEHLMNYREFIYIGIRNMGESMSPKGDPMGMCGLCALPELKAMGVCSLKIVGRESPLKKKTASVRLLKRSLDILEGEENPEILRLCFQMMRGIPKLCNCKYMCYYRE
ncbi:collagenase-like protease [Desulfosporosinus acidiphilus SJ4]|uniref:Collagenase-like protease n=1 Tax=Desulfosporosinus acidiphilus (strain DSM 22704 / JCM 16185 / SJ4) TaxID=646529 RepID=I4D2X6_DESAJ|nr:peptidase U32 family protein [Desulfosporosinus acidiphilus]AFM40150.1 collagenase-like protease [Desulfosporosinus acidiphilus SJ4]